MHIFVTASRAELAWTVHMPGIPEFSRLAFGTLPPIEALGRIRDAIREYDGA